MTYIVFPFDLEECDEYAASRLEDPDLLKQQLDREGLNVTGMKIQRRSGYIEGAVVTLAGDRKVHIRNAAITTPRAFVSGNLMESSPMNIPAVECNINCNGNCESVTAALIRSLHSYTPMEVLSQY